MVNKYIFNCDLCTTRCDGVSKGIYIFSNDVDYSELKERKLISQITLDGKAYYLTTIPLIYSPEFYTSNLEWMKKEKPS